MGERDLTDVDVYDLLDEVQRRMLCSLKPQKRVILIGNSLLSDVLAACLH